ncbi:hypothetical protein [Tropicibacter naphthalenivorans]|uniref:Uncharacterized protein n=1 Tax=Tropicibacter naphthalenivorans TaxID=441103 RepID=A0A0P1GE09_9RHOB|nr:hypothetical protein [Tropicibacter naphthalenivorans]CUH79613.1 hypothetical protein TRN7648_02561 [Tropicibacter naphthalenivorans]SMC73758.1 hypothetical protein SAMN04488093_103190 [Tropicibacter naphthalenivorans]
MKSWRMYRHSFRMIWENLGTALQVTGVLFLIQMAPQFYLFANPMPLDEMGMPQLPADMVMPLFGLLMLSVVSSAWMAVAWHRYVLTGELSGGVIPPWHGRLVLGYVGRMLLIGLVMLLAGLLLLIPLTLLLLALPFATMFGMLAYLAALAFLALRFAMILPAGAMGRRLVLTEIWNTTAEDWGALVALAILLVGTIFVVQIPTSILGGVFTLPGLVWLLGANWFIAMMSMTVLTTLYGVYIEGREIP